MSTQLVKLKVGSSKVVFNLIKSSSVLLKGRTALMICAEMGYAEVAKVLLSKNADASLKDGEGKTATDIAKQSRKGSEVIKLLAK